MKKKTERFKRRMIGMTPAQWRWLDSEHNRTGMSLSEIVRRAIDFYRENQDWKDKEKGQEK